MLIMAWNCQGVGRPRTIRRLRDLCNSRRPSVVFLSETKNKQDKLEQVRRSIGFDYFCYVDPIGKSGGLALWWNNNVEFTLNYTRQSEITGWLNSRDNRPTFYISFIYAATEPNNRAPMWKSIIETANIISSPWLLIGDFNVIASPALVDIGCSGNIFTWRRIENKQVKIHERLDRCLANVDWCTLFPNTKTEHGLFEASDHKPIFLDLAVKTPGRKPFRYEANWKSCPDFDNTVITAWSSVQEGSRTRS
jgi:hypothetical protein